MIDVHCDISWSLIIFQNISRVQALRLIEILSHISNIIQYPNEEKYRKVKIGNKTFNADVWSLPEAQQFLWDWGWMKVCWYTLYYDVGPALVK